MLNFRPMNAEILAYSNPISINQTNVAEVHSIRRLINEEILPGGFARTHVIT